MRLINSVNLINIINTSVTHSFISLDYATKLSLVVPVMSVSMVIDTPTNGSMTTSLVCLNFLLTIYGREFRVDLIYLPLILLDVILGMNWLEFNRVNINFFDKTVTFLEPEESTDLDSCMHVRYRCA